MIRRRKIDGIDQSSKTSTGRFSEVKVGLIAGAGGVVRLPRTIPPKLDNEMILGGRRLTADGPLSYGLVDPDGQRGRDRGPDAFAQKRKPQWRNR